MESTMMDFQLTVSAIMRYGTTVFGDKEVVTCAGDEPSRRRTYAAVGERTARLANALRSLGVDGDQRVGTFMWNNAEHLEAYLAIPSMGAVLHTLNIRLSADQVGYIATHAGDHAVIVDSSLVPLFAKVLPYADTIRHVIVSGPADDEALASLAGHGREVHSYEELLAAAADSFDWPEIDERSAAAMCYTSGTTGLPKGVAYSHRSTYLHSMAVCTANALAVSERDRVMPIVPMFHANAWGLAYAAMMSGADLVMPDRFMVPDVIAKLIETEKVTVGAGVPTIWQGMLAHLRTAGGDMSSLRTLVCGGSALPEAVMRAYADEFGIVMTHAWGMTELSPIGSVAREPAGVTGEAVWPYRASQGRLVCGVEGRLTADDGRGTAVRREGRRRARDARTVDHRVVLQGPRAGEVQRRLAAHRRRRHPGRGRLHQAHRPGQGRDQVRRRVDLVHGAREHPDGPPVRGRGGGGGRAGRAVGRTAAGRRRAAGRRAPGDPGRAARLPRRADSPLAAPRALVPTSTRCRRPPSASSRRPRCGTRYADGDLEVTTLAPLPH